ncbi:MAG: ABC transporter substrate-binding protein [Candidatus Omnitrophica bacterium]|nr:ABC transporter substrate-binding protein [Candidatus Omnitrophota bacterium]
MVLRDFAIKTLLAAVLFAGSLANGYAQDTCPQRIISLVPTITEEIYLLGAQDGLVADTVYCRRPPEAQDKEKIGTVVDVNLEKIIALRPDLVLGSTLTNLRSVRKLENLGIRTVIYPSAKSFNEICAQFLELAVLLGKEKEAQEIIKEVRFKTDAIKEKYAASGKPKVFLQIGARPLFAASRGSFLNDFIEFAGGVNVVSQVKAGLYSREQVLESNPDIIIIANMGIAGEEERRAWQRYKDLKAVKNNRIYIIDSYRLCSPTPVSFTQTLQEIAAILHPDNE